MNVHFIAPQEEEVHYSSWGYRYAHSAAHSSKRFEPLSGVILLCQGIVKLKKHKQQIQLCYVVYNETKYHFEIPICFWFQWMSLSNLFLIKFLKFLVLGLWLYDFWFYHTNDFKSPLTPSWRWIKKLSAKTTKYIPKCWERSVTRKSNLNFTRVTKDSSFDQHFLYVWSKPS